MLLPSSSRPRLRYVWFYNFHCSSILSTQELSLTNNDVEIQTTVLSSSTSVPSSTSVSSTNMPSADQQATATDPDRLPINTSGSSTSSVSAGESAGIGIGAGVGVLVLALLAWLVYRRRNKVKTSYKETSSPNQEIQSTSTSYYQHGNSSRAVSKSPLHEAPSSQSRSPLAELEGR